MRAWVAGESDIALRPLSAWNRDALTRHVQHNSRYFEKCVLMPLDDIHPWAKGRREGRKCWDLTEQIIGENFSFYFEDRESDKPKGTQGTIRRPDLLLEDLSIEPHIDRHI